MIAAIGRLVTHLLAELDDDQQRLVRGGPLEDPAEHEWTYLPGDRPGLSLADLDDRPREIVDELLTATSGELGAELAHGAIAAERARRQLASGHDEIGGDRYWVRVSGRPDGPEPWGWRLNGHHLAVHAVVVGDRMTVTPHFIGAEPALILSGPMAGRRLLGPEEDLARRLVLSLDSDQQAVAIVAEEAPDDILTRHDPVADPSVVPVGLARDDLQPSQQDLLDQLARRYLDRAPAPYAAVCWQEAFEAAPDAVRFAWAGPTAPGAGVYYAVTAPTWLIEYDNTQDGANHAHSVWRHLRDDFGRDLLREHYATHHHHHHED